VVPLNALLQERGKQTVGAGNAIAVQNLGENLAMLLMLGLYSLAVKVGVPVVGIGVGFGGAVCAGDCRIVGLAASPLICAA
jgi:LPLT family lysophospholipid transporter-like MFS transporter